MKDTNTIERWLGVQTLLPLLNFGLSCALTDVAIADLKLKAKEAGLVLQFLTWSSHVIPPENVPEP